jgi:DNA invertase Pin-like site-specific DNA recombinase
MDGIKKAKESGVSFGRNKMLSKEQHQELIKKRAEGVLIKALMKEFNLSKASIYRYLSSK